MNQPAAAATETPEQTYPLAIPGLGDFVFRRKTRRRSLAIEAEASRLQMGALQPTYELAITSRAIAVCNHLMVESPEGFPNVNDEMFDPFEEETFALLYKVAAAVKKQEDFFRLGGGQKRMGAGPADGGDSRV